MAADHKPGHALKFLGASLDIYRARWSCECGKWEAATPDKGPFGSTTTKARIAQVKMAHGKHVKFAA